jgi:hypothetical protein
MYSLGSINCSAVRTDRTSIAWAPKPMAIISPGYRNYHSSHHGEPGKSNNYRIGVTDVMIENQRENANQRIDTDFGEQRGEYRRDRHWRCLVLPGSKKLWKDTGS